MIGGSLALALKANKSVDHVVGFSRSASNLKKAVALGILDSYSSNMAEVLKHCDMLVLAVPLGAMPLMLEKIAPHLPDACIVTDVASVKATVVDAAKKLLPNHYVNFVPAHPIAGTEKSGVEAGFAELFKQHKVIITPDKSTSNAAVKAVIEMWENCSARVETMSVSHHDEIFAATSHLPHLLAYSLVNCLANMEDRLDVFDYAAGGFKDISRIASSDPTMWRDICLHNKDSLAKVLKDYSYELLSLSKKIDNLESAELLAYFTRAKTRRDDLIGRC